MKRLAGIQAKTLLCAHDTPLLWRLLDQLRAAGFSRIVAATTPRLRASIRASLAEYSRTTAPGIELEVVASAAQERGVVFGLARLLERWTDDRSLLCFGDIFFLANPFPAFRQHLESSAVHLGVTPRTLENEWRLGGLVYEDGGEVVSIVERPSSAPTGTPLRWSGVALFDRRPALEDLARFVAESPDDPPPGEFFEFQRQRGRDLRCEPGPDFVNVNSPDHLLLASLYARLEACPPGEPLATSLAEAARTLRLDLVRPQRRETP
jgi:NDP-sugar pyrophosphorylase family protein